MGFYEDTRRQAENTRLREIKLREIKRRIKLTEFIHLAYDFTEVECRFLLDCFGINYSHLDDVYMLRERVVDHIQDGRIDLSRVTFDERWKG
jgi:hypothetical protein